MQDLVSVIVPVYKVEKFLSRCVESILKQTYSNLEIILVDDGSPDSCPEMCDCLRIIDSRIKVIHKENGGLSDARNCGIELAKGEYLLFVDSDDFIEPTMIENMLNAVYRDNTKLVISNFKLLNEDGDLIKAESKSPIIQGVYHAFELMPKIYQKLGWYYVVAWNKLYHRSLFDNIKFPKGKIHEDEFIFAQIIMEAEKITCIASEEYNYIFQRKGSIMNTRALQSQLDWLEALYGRFKFCHSNENLVDFVKETRAVYFRELSNLFLNSKLVTQLNMDQKKKVKQMYCQMDGKSINEKINWFLFNIHPKIQNIIMKFIRNI